MSVPIRGWILYDADCRMCRDMMQRFEKTFTSRGFAFAPLQLELKPSERPPEMRVRTTNGRDFGGADAVLFLAGFVWGGPATQVVCATSRREKIAAQNLSRDRGAPFLRQRRLPVAGGADMKPRVVLAGGSGFLGKVLAKAILGKGYEVVILSRGAHREGSEIRQLHWDGKTLGDWLQSIDGAKAIVNLTGRSVNCRHTPEHRREIMESRVDSVRVLGEAVSRCDQPPEVWVQASSLAIYGNPGDRWCDEDAPHAKGFSEEVCKRWEGEFEKVHAQGMRKVAMRIGIVLDKNEGALPVLARLTRFFLGGRVGSGRQYVSWIHIADLIRMFLEAIECPELSGVFNVTGPNPVTNAEFMRELRRALHRPWSPPVPAWATHIGAFLMRTEPSLALTGRRCRPKRFLESGFHFEFPELHGALSDLYR